MAQITIVYVDTPDGNYTAEIKFEPELVPGQPLTTVQQLGVEFQEKLLANAAPNP